jgi:hypothetical protein
MITDSLREINRIVVVTSHNTNYPPVPVDSTAGREQAPAMAGADTPIPKFKAYAEGEPIPPVDPGDIKCICEYQRTHSRVGANGYQWLQGLKSAISAEADFSDVSSRHQMIETLIRYTAPS